MKLTHLLVLSLLVAAIASQSSVSSHLYSALGLHHYMMDLARINATGPYYGPNTDLFRREPTMVRYIQQFTNRTQFCDTKCLRIWQIHCMVLFGCNIHIRNFVLVFIAPLLLIAITGSCCGKGVWTVPCWLRYLWYLSGVGVLFWGLRKLWQRARMKKQQSIENEDKNKQMTVQHRND